MKNKQKKCTFSLSNNEKLVLIKKYQIGSTHDYFKIYEAIVLKRDFKQDGPLSFLFKHDSFDFHPDAFDLNNDAFKCHHDTFEFHHDTFVFHHNAFCSHFYYKFEFFHKGFDFHKDFFLLQARCIGQVSPYFRILALL